MDIYLVGGAVRDRLIGVPVKEKDYVVVGTSPEVLIAQGFKPVGKDFPVFLHPTTHEEYALARTERKQSKGYKGFSIHADPTVTLIEDLKRRDLTINAIAQRESTGELFDPYRGTKDLQAKTLRHVSSAFIEDPVRILRVARFMARFSHLGFKIASETLELMQTMVASGEVDALVPDRIWLEFERALGERTPISFVETLLSCGAWEKLCPEWKASLTATDHSLRALQIASELTTDTQVRFASLMHTIDFEKVQSLAVRWRLPRAYRDLLLLSVKYIKTLHRFSRLTTKELLELLERVDVIRKENRFQQLIRVAEAAWRSSTQESTYPPKAFLEKAVGAIRSVNVKPLVQAKLSGQEFSKQLKALRLQALQASGF